MVYYTIVDRMPHRMKITALMDDELIRDVRTFSGGKNITESLVIALNDWLRIQKLRRLNAEIEKAPLHFADSFSASSVRRLNQRRHP